MTIKPPTFQPKKRMHVADWKLFQEHIKAAPALHMDSPEDAVKAAADIQKIIQQAIDKSVPMSTPGKKSKAWWNSDITKAKSELAKAKREARMDPRSEEKKAKQKELATQWRRLIRHAQWKYWENTFRSADKGHAIKAIKAAGKMKAIQSLPDILSISTFQGKRRVLRAQFFPANVDTLPRCRMAF